MFVMDTQNYMILKETEVWAAWKEGMAKGAILGFVVGASLIGLLGLTVCPRV